MLKVAILEDDKFILKDLKQKLENTGLVKVVAWATSSDKFIDKANELKPDALILDIELTGDSMSGLDVANLLKLPTLFVSGKIGNFYNHIEDINADLNVVVEHISKPVHEAKLTKILSKFVDQINALKKIEYIFLDFYGSQKNKIAVNDIVYLCADKTKGSESNNKVIYFTNRRPEILINFTLSKMDEKGFDPKIFITTHKSFRVNAGKIRNYNKEDRTIEVDAVNWNGKQEIMSIPVSENYRKILRA